MSQIVQVVSILEVIMSLGESLFQSSEVKGAVCSGVLEFESRASGVSFCRGCAFWLTLDDREMVLLVNCGILDAGRDHSRR